MTSVTNYKLWDPGSIKIPKKDARRKDQIEVDFNKTVTKELTIFKGVSEDGVGRHIKQFVTHLTLGNLTSADVDSISSILEKDRVGAVKLCDITLRLMSAADAFKMTDKRNQNLLKRQMAAALKDCSIDDLDEIKDPALYHAVLNEKFSTSSATIDVSSAQKIASKLGEFKKSPHNMKYNPPEHFTTALLKLSSEDFNKAVTYLQDNLKNNDILAEVVEQKVKDAPSITDKFKIIDKNFSFIKKDLRQAIVESFSSKDISEWNVVAEKIKDMKPEDKELFLIRYLSGQKEIGFTLDSFLETYKKTGLKADDLHRVIPFVMKAFPDVRASKHLEQELIKQVFESGNTENKVAVARALTLNEPLLFVEIMNHLFRDAFTMEQKVKTAAAVLAQTKKISEFSKDPQLGVLKTILSAALTGGLNDDVANCCKILSIRDTSILVKVLEASAFRGVKGTPQFTALQKEQGIGNVMSFPGFYDATDSWGRSDKIKYYDTLLNAISEPDLMMNRIDFLSLDDSDKVNILLDNIGTLPLASVCQKCEEFKIKERPKSSSTRVECLKCLDLGDLKNNATKKSAEVKNESLDLAKIAIKESLSSYPGLVGVFDKFEKTLPKDNDFEVTRALIAFANFADQMKGVYDTNADKKENITDYLNKSQLTINSMLTVNKPNSARFLLSKKFIDAMPADFKFSGRAIDTEPKAVEQVINMQLAAFYPEKKSAATPFGTGTGINKQSGYLAEILTGLERIENDPLIRESDKKFLIDFILGEEPKPPESIDSKQIQAHLGLVKTIINLKGSSHLGRVNLLLSEGKSREEILKKIVEKSFVDILGGQISAEVAPGLMKKLEETRDPTLIYTMAGKFNNLPAEKKDDYFKKFGEVCTAYAKGEFEKARYSQSPHLNEMKRKMSTIKSTFSVSQWKKAALEPGLKVKDLVSSEKLTAKSLEDSHVFLSDDFIDLIAMGTEIQGSCLSIKTGDVSDIKDILGNVMDGKTKLVTIKKEEGDSIQGRVALKLLWDEENNTPVILMEGIYTNFPTVSDERRVLEIALNNASLKIAQRLGIPLVRGHSSKTTTPYPEPIRSLGRNLAPSEKCDPLAESKISGQTYNPEEEAKGNYILHKTELVWRPPEEGRVMRLRGG